MTSDVDPLQLLTDLPNGSVSIFDRDLRYVYAAGQGLHEVGLTPDALIGKRLTEAFPADATLLVEHEYRRAFDGESVVFGLHYFHRTYSLSAAPFQSANGRVEQIIVVAQDITMLTTSAAPPADAPDADPHRFIATLGHELRNPLGAIRAALAVIEHSADRGSRERARAVIERQVVTAEMLIQDLTELSRAERGVLRVRYSEVSVKRVVDDAIAAVEHLAASKGDRLMVGAPAPGLRVRADGPRLVQVLTNLLANAIRYSPEGGEIAVTTRLTPDSVSLAVTDRGKGIAPQALDGIFDVFHRGREVEADGGLGDGLWVAREIVQRHGGRIDVFSAGEGQGATFTVRLPLALLVTAASDH